MLIQWSSSAPLVLHRCSSSDPPMLLQCSSSAPRVLLQCFSNAPPMLLQCSSNAPPMILGCSSSAPPMPIQCSSNALPVHVCHLGVLASHQPDRNPLIISETDTPKRINSQNAGSAKPLYVRILNSDFVVTLIRQPRRRPYWVCDRDSPYHMIVMSVRTLLYVDRDERTVLYCMLKLELYRHTVHMLQRSQLMTRWCKHVTKCRQSYCTVWENCRKKAWPVSKAHWICGRMMPLEWILVSRYYDLGTVLHCAVYCFVTIYHNMDHMLLKDTVHLLYCIQVP